MSVSVSISLLVSVAINPGSILSLFLVQSFLSLSQYGHICPVPDFYVWDTIGYADHWDYKFCLRGVLQDIKH